MKIFVCIKQVPDTETKIKLSADGLSVDPNGVKWVMNPYDEFAVEESIKIKEKNAGAQIFAVTFGPKKRTADCLRTALAMGADEGIIIDGPEYSEPSLAAKALAKLIQNEGGADLVLTGKQAIDDNAFSVSQMIAEHLNIPHATAVSKCSIEGGKATLTSDLDGGAKAQLELTLPCLIAANKGLNMPRYASLPGIMKAKKKVLKEVDLASLGIDMQNQTKILSLELPADKPAVKMLSGDSQAQATALVHALRDEAKVL